MENNSKYFAADLAKYYSIEFGTTQPTIGQKVRLWTTNFGLHCVAIYRIGRFSERLYSKIGFLALPMILIHRVLDYGMRLFLQVHIDDAKLGKGFYIGHIGTIFLGPITIGENCNLTHNVTIGVGHSDGKAGIPVIGDNVWIGTGSTIYGAISIGNNVTIMNGSMVSRSIADGCLAEGNPARVIIQNYDNRLLMGYNCK
jgi:serine O-acetyltransferase